jgi:hypothetical protein
MTKKTIAELTAKAEAEDEIIRLHTAAIKRDGLRLNQLQIQALDDLLDYCFGDECDDFEEKLDEIDALYVRGKDGQYPEIGGAELERNHIFLAILTLQNALLGLHRTPGDVIRAREMELTTKKRSYGGREKV